tara:strand:+ start:4178 stop:5032 length:855 start_codon:yes stop_codon:yes gene_type:complete
MIKLLKFFFSKLFLVNLALAITVLYLLFYFTMNNLDSFTNHGEKIEVPSLIGNHIEDIEDTLQSLSLRYEIRDSVYSDNYPLGFIIQQDPKPNIAGFSSYVKPNRRIYLTIVKKQESFKIIPDLISKVTSKTIGKSRLEALGFKVELKMKDHKDRDKVLEIIHNEYPVSAGTKIPKGAELVLVFGSGKKGIPIELPNFKGMNIELAKKTASIIGLELDIHYYDSLKMNHKDSLNAIVFNQYPDPEINNKSVVSVGSVVILDASHKNSSDSLIILDANQVIQKGE